MQTSIDFEILTPEGLPDPLPKLQEYLSILHRKLGKERLDACLELSITEWAIASGYRAEFDGNKCKLTHYAI